MKHTLPAGLVTLWRDSPGYESARSRAFNQRIPPELPYAIVRPKNVEQIQHAVQLAIDLDKQIRIRSGGHSLAGWTLCADSILIDLVDFRHLEYDATTAIASASPSTTSAQLNDLLVAHGRFVPVGHCGDVGLGGFFLQGGMGLNCRSYGWACEYLVGVDLITADGEYKHCSESENADLFWAARGAGPEFPAIVTRFFIQTRPAAAKYEKSTFIWPVDFSEPVVSWILKILPELHADIEPLVVSTIVPGLNVAAILVQFLVFLGTNETGAEKLEPSLTAMPDGTLMQFKGQSTSLQQEYVSQEGTMPQDSRYICDSVWFKDGIDFVAVTRRMFREFPRDRSMVYWEPLYPTSRRKLPDMAFSLQADQYLALYAIFEDSQQDEEQGTRIQGFIQEIKPYVLGTFAADGVPEVRKTQYWSAEVIERLYSVCQKWDPAHRLGCTLLDPTRKMKS
ncbi:unnamed protein product [Penicillium glandicola]